MKKLIILAALAVATIAYATEEEKTESLDSIIEVYRIGDKEQVDEAFAKLKEMYPGYHKAMDDMIRRTLSEEEKLKSLEDQLENLEVEITVKKAVVEALNKRLHGYLEDDTKRQEGSDG
jgi:3-keto-L-gulonate-6-phosphate decarboxylase